jgi:hypothetical protein
MGRNGIRVSIFLLLISGFAWGQAKVLHSPPRNIFMNSPIKIEALIEESIVQVERVRIFYREAGQNAFIEEEMEEYMGVYTCNIPAEYVTEEGVEYLIMAELSDGSMTAYPEVDPYNVPMFLAVKQLSDIRQQTVRERSDIQGGIRSDIIILSPEEGEVVAAEEVVLAFSLFNTPDVSLETIQLDLDGISVLNQTEISEDMIISRPKNLSPGLHTIKLNMKNQYGDPYSTIIVNFSVVRTVEESQRVFKYTGRVSAEANSEQVRGIRQNINSLRANASGSYDWLKFNAKTFISSQEDPDKQPRNRFTVGFRTSVFDLSLGDVNPRFSEFALRGKRVRGVDANLKLKYFNTHIVYGETVRAIQGTISDEPDSVAGGFQYNRSGYTYSQNLLAIRPYFGSGQNFQFGFSVLKAIDDTLSVKKEYGGIRESSDVSIAMEGSKKPRDNIVLGTDLIIAFDSKRFVWKSDAAISLLNRDISQGPLTLEDLDTFFPGDSLRDSTLSLGDMNISLEGFPDPSDFARFFIINLNLKPLMPIVPDTSGAIGMKEFLNMPSTAFKTTLKLNYFNNFFVVRYQRVGPEFSSLGNPYLRSDIQGFNISDKIRLFSNKLFVTLAYDQKRDNLSQDKNSTTTTTSFNAGLALYPGGGLPTINFNTMHYGRQNDLDVEDIIIDSVFHDVVLDSIIGFTYKDLRESNSTIRQDFRISHIVEIADIKNTINITYANSDRSDRITDRVPGYQFNATSTSMLAFGVNSSFPFPLKTNVKFSTNTTKSTQIKKPYELFNMMLRGRYEFFDGKLVTELGYNLTSGSGMINFTKNNVFMGGMYRFLEMHQLRWRLRYSLLNDRLSGDTFSDLSFMVNYTLLF